MYKVDLSAKQPLYYKKSALMAGINGGLEGEFGRFHDSIEKLTRELNINTAVECIDLWEQSVGLPVNTDLSIESRRSRVLSRLRQVDTTTPERIKVIVQSYARGDVEVIEDFARYTVEIKFSNRIGKPDNMDGIIEQLDRIMPAHLAVTYIYPYRAWEDLKKNGLTWGQLTAVTWKDVMEKEALA